MRLAFLSALFLLAAPAFAQDESAVGPGEVHIEAGLEALREGDPRRALADFARAVEAEPENAEARFRLSGVLFAEGPLQDLDRARSQIRRAVELEPQNVAYMTAEMETLKGGAWNFFMDLARARRRIVLAGRILALDSLNAFAHEELATATIRDYYQYRNAIWTSSFAFEPTGFTASDDLGDEPVSLEDLESEDLPEGTAGPDLSTAPETFGAPDPWEPQDVGARGDRFNVDQLLETGASSYEGRAQKALERATYHLRIALEQDPRRKGLYTDVMRLAALSGDWRSASGPLRQMLIHFPDDPEMWRYVGLINHRLGDWEAADAAFDNALEHMSEEELRVFSDLSMVLPPGERDAYRADPETYAARFWSARDPRFLNPYNERRLEHYARLTTANLLYRSGDLDLPGWRTERGEVFVRYGTPIRDVIIEGEFGVVVEQFAGRIESYNTARMVGLSNRFNVWDYGDLTFVFEDPSRNGEFVLYSPPADVFGLRSGARAHEMDFVLRAAETFRQTPERYDFQVPGRSVNIPARVTAFKGEGDRADVYVHFGVPLAEGAGEDGRSVDTNLLTGAFLVDGDNRLLGERRKTVYGLRADQIVPYKAVNLWVGTETLDARPGGYDVAVEFETADGGVAGVHRESVEITDFTSPGLHLSDLLLAVQVEEGVAAGPGRIARGDFAIQPAPWGIYTIGDPIVVYFEAYGLSASDGPPQYQVEARLVPKDRSRGLGRFIKRLFGSRERGVSTAFPVQASGPDDRQYLLLDATGQEPGLYTLTLRIKDEATGESDKRTVELLLE